MKKLIAVVFLLCACSSSFAVVSGVQPSVGSVAVADFRTTAVATASDVLGTTVALPANATAVVCYVTTDKGSATNFVITPAGAISGNPASTGYYGNTAKAQTLTNDGRHVVRFERVDFGAQKYCSVYCRVTGTPTSSGCSIQYKFEY